jgi:hypothetical protein
MTAGIMHRPLSNDSSFQSLQFQLTIPLTKTRQKAYGSYGRFLLILYGIVIPPTNTEVRRCVK